MISPKEKEDAIAIEKLLIDRLLGAPQVPKEVCYFSIPANPIDAQMDSIWHRGVYAGILTQLGYSPGTADGSYGPKTEAAVVEFQTPPESSS
jgi:peptidoglycan hydrolase-like protein with peptidoglycan-binding domain